MWDLIVSVPDDHCLSFYFSKSIAREPLLTLKLKSDHNGFSRTAQAVLQ